MSLNVCVECGARVRRLVRKLQFDNYCLEKCVSSHLKLLTYTHNQHECQQEADKFLEYERNLKILNIILCNPQIYRHIFFNHDTIKNIKKYCFIFTLAFLLMLYAHESREKLIASGQADFKSMLLVRNETSGELKILPSVDTDQVQKIVIQFISYILTIVVSTYLFKKFQFMRRNQQSKNSLLNLITLVYRAQLEPVEFWPSRAYLVRLYNLQHWLFGDLC